MKIFKKIEISDTPVPVSNIVERINVFVDTDKMKKITYRNVTDWLIGVGMLMTQTRFDGVKNKRPTVQGEALGITTEHRRRMNGDEYTVVLYNRAAQEFIIDNIDAIISMINDK